MALISIGIVDDEILIVELLSRFFADIDEISILVKSNSGEAFIETLNNSSIQPDVVIMDLRMDGMNGTETIKIMRQKFPNIKSIVLSSHYKLPFIGFMLQSGANAFLPKNIDPEALLSVIKEVYDKGHYFTNEQLNMLGDQLAFNIPTPPQNPINALTKREFEVLQLICRQHSTKEIGEKLFIAIRTVEGHRSNLLLKTQTKNSTGLVIYAIQNGIIKPEELLLD